MRIVLIFLLFSRLAFGQSDSAIPAEKIFEFTEVSTPPQFPGGEKELMLFLTRNIRLPAVKDPDDFPGKTVAAFVVNKDGSISDVEIAKGAGPFGDEVKRVLGTMPLWAPATLNGFPVRVRMNLPIHPHPDQSGPEKKLSSVLHPIDSALVWEGVRIKTEEIFQENDIKPSFRIKKNKDKRRALAEALEGQFQVNMSDDDVRSMKRAGALADYIFRAQNGLICLAKQVFRERWNA